MSFLLSLLLLIQTITTPTISSTDGGEHLLVKYQAGAKMACTIFEMQTSEGYAPKHCWLVEEDSTNYIDDWNLIPPYNADWKVYSEVAYQNENGDPVFVESNRLDIHR